MCQPVLPTPDMITKSNSDPKQTCAALSSVVGHTKDISVWRGGMVVECGLDLQYFVDCLARLTSQGAFFVLIVAEFAESTEMKLICSIICSLSKTVKRV